MGSWKRGLPLRFKSPAIQPRDQGIEIQSARRAARTFKRVPKQCLVSEVGLAPGPPFAGVIKTFFIRFFHREFLVSALLGFRDFGVLEKGAAFKTQRPGLLGSTLASQQALTPLKQAQNLSNNAGFREPFDVNQGLSNCQDALNNSANDF